MNIYKSLLLFLASTQIALGSQSKSYFTAENINPVHIFATFATALLVGKVFFYDPQMKKDNELIKDLLNQTSFLRNNKYVVDKELAIPFQEITEKKKQELIELEKKKRKYDEKNTILKNRKELFEIEKKDLEQTKMRYKESINIANQLKQENTNLKNDLNSTKQKLQTEQEKEKFSKEIIKKLVKAKAKIHIPKRFNFIDSLGSLESSPFRINILEETDNDTILQFVRIKNI